MKKLTIPQSIAVQESMRNLAIKVKSLDTEIDISTYVVFETLINKNFKINIDNKKYFFDGEIPQNIKELIKNNS